MSHTLLEGRHKRSSAAILNIKQWEDESLRSYVTRFNKEAFLIHKADDKVLVTAFTSGLKQREFLFSIYKNDLKTMAEALYKAMKYMNVDAVMITQRDMLRKRE